MDDWEGGNAVFGNIFYETQTAFFSNCGSDMNFTNNMFVNSEVAVRQSGLDLAQNLYQPFLSTGVETAFFIVAPFNFILTMINVPRQGSGQT